MSLVSKDLAAFIAGDWGTSNLRLTLCDAEGQALDVRKGPGAAESRGKHAEIFDTLSAEWRCANGALPAVLSGMVGSTIGWREVPYLKCPARPSAISATTLMAGSPFNTSHNPMRKIG